MKKRINIPLLIAIFLLFVAGQAFAAKLVSEARSVIDGIGEKSKTLSGTLTEFHTEFSARASKMVQLEAAVEELKEKGYLGETYAQSPEKHERIYSEYARYLSEIKEVFTKYAPLIQSRIKSFNRSIYMGRDRLELSSDQMAVVETEIKAGRNTLRELRHEREQLEKKCSRDGKISRNCRREWGSYDRKLARLTMTVARLKYMKKMHSIKDSINGNLEKILDRYVNRETEMTDVLLNYTFAFEQYASFIGNNEIGGMLKAVRELDGMEKKIKHLVAWEQGVQEIVKETGKMVYGRLDHYMKQGNIQDPDVESHSGLLKNYEGRENQVEQMINEMEKG